ncbi:NEDD8 ultimate buster 1-like isoform X2 [Scyliorhinus torazame]|uniref:NEDD8 ultimate buster 1-like isoform X2 n=1 Tax=Scyliorhinus torazame TaxID=75743 RepID=UPI003B59A28B
MAEGGKTVVNQQEQDIGHAVESDGGARQEGACSGSGTFVLRIQIPKIGQRQKEKITITISPGAPGLQLFKEISRLAGIEVKNMRLIFKGKELKMDQTLKEQNVKANVLIMLSLVNTYEREETHSLSRIRRGAELLAKQDEDFEKPYLKIVNHKGEIIEIPKEQHVMILTALILHEKGRSDMKKAKYKEALEFLKLAELEFRKCDQVQLNSIDNYGVLNLDACWCYLKLRDIEQLKDAKERLENAQRYFTNCFGENEERLQQLEDDSGRHKILFLRLYVLRGVYFYHRHMMKDALSDLTEAETQLDALRLDDFDVVCLANEGFTTREARFGLRATGGDIEKAKLYINKKRERAQQQRREADERREQLRSRAQAAGGQLQQRARQQRSEADERREQLSRTNNTAQAVTDVNRVAEQGNQVSSLNTNPSRPVDTLTPPGTLTSPAPTSPPPGAPDNSENNVNLEDILSFLHLDDDDYIDVTLEDEEALIQEYLAKLKNNDKVLDEDTPPAPKKPKAAVVINDTPKDTESSSEDGKEELPADTPPCDPDKDSTSVSPSPNPPSAEIQIDPTPGPDNQSKTIENPPLTNEPEPTDNPDQTENDAKQNEEEVEAEVKMVPEELPADTPPCDPHKDSTSVSPSPNPPSAEIQIDPTPGPDNQSKTIENPPLTNEPEPTDNPDQTENDAKQNEEEVEAEVKMVYEDLSTDTSLCNPDQTNNGQNSNEVPKQAKVDHKMAEAEDILSCGCGCVAILFLCFSLFIYRMWSTTR